LKVTPLDIRRKEFKRSVRGYSDEEVDLFLDEVADEIERLSQENVELQDRIRRLEEQLAGHAQLRDALEKTLVTAQFQADETKANAHKEGELILRDAELKARGIVSESYSEIQRVQQALIQLKHLEEDFRFKFRSLLEGHLKLLDEAPINMGAGQSVMAEAPSPTAEETPFVVPAAVVEVPEYPPVVQAAIKPESLVAPETATGVLTAAVMSLSTPTALEPSASEQAASAEAEPEAADLWDAESPTEGGGETETAEQASVFAEFDKTDAAGRSDGGSGTPAAPREEDPLSGFFFNSKPDVPDEVYLDGDKGGTVKPRDFEW
jgi:cell division initiation protein